MSVCPFVSLPVCSPLRLSVCPVRPHFSFELGLEWFLSIACRLDVSDIYKKYIIIFFHFNVSDQSPPYDSGLCLFSVHSSRLRSSFQSLLFPGPSSLLTTWPYHFNLLSGTFSHISPNIVVPLILSLLILSNFVTPHIRLNILTLATSNFFSCAFFNAHACY